MACRLPHSNTLDNVRAAAEDAGLRRDGAYVQGERLSAFAERFNASLSEDYGERVRVLVEVAGEGVVENAAGITRVEAIREAAGLRGTTAAMPRGLPVSRSRDRAIALAKARELAASTGVRYRVVARGGSYAAVPTASSISGVSPEASAFLTRLSERTGLAIEVLEPGRFDREAAALGGGRASRGMVSGNVIKLKSGAWDAGTALHEVAHVIEAAIARDNPLTHANLMREIRSDSSLAAEEAAMVARGVDPSVAASEVFAKALSEASRSPEAAKRPWFKRVWRQIAAALERMGFLDVASPSVRLADLRVGLLGGASFDLRGAAVAGTLFDDGGGPRSSYTADTAAYLANYASRGKVPTVQQSKTVATLDDIRIRFGEHVSGRRVLATADGKRYTGVSRFLDANGHAFDGESTDDPIPREMGNQIDDIVRETIAGKSFADAYIAVSRERDARRQRDSLPEIVVRRRALEKVYDDIVALQDRFPQMVFVADAPLISDHAGVTGKADILMVHPDGSVMVVDVKTSGAMGIHAKSLTRYRAQVSAYAGMVADGGLVPNRRRGILNYSKVGIDRDAPNVLQQVGLTGGAKANLITAPSIVAIESAMTSAERQRKLVAKSIVRDGDFGEVLSGARALIADRIAFLNQDPDLRYQSRELESLMRDLEITDSIGAIQLLAEAGVKQLRTGQHREGVFQKASSVIVAFKQNEAPVDVLVKAQAALDELLPWQPVLERITTAFTLEHNSAAIAQLDGDHPIRVISDLLDTTRSLVVRLQDIQPKATAKYVWPILSKAHSAIADQIAFKEERLARVRAKNKSDAKRVAKYRRRADALQAEIEEAESRGESQTDGTQDLRRKMKRAIEQTEGLTSFALQTMKEIDQLRQVHITDEASLAESFAKNSFFDISVVDKWLEDPDSISNPLIASAALAIRDGFARVQIGSTEAAEELERVSLALAEAKGVSKDRKHDLYASVLADVKTYAGVDAEGKPRYVDDVALLSPLDEHAYHEALMKMYAEREHLPPDRRRGVLETFYLEHTEDIPAEDIVIDGVVVREGLNTIAERAIAKEGRKRWERYLEESVITLTDGTKRYRAAQLTMPKRSRYRSAAFDALMRQPPSSPERVAWATYARHLTEAKRAMPIRNTSVHLWTMPSVMKTRTERFVEQGVGAYADQVRRETQVRHVGEDPERAYDLGHVYRRVEVIDEATAATLDPLNVDRDVETGIIYRTEFSPDERSEVDGVIPTRYTQTMKAEHKSRNVPRSLLMFKQAADTYVERRRNRAILLPLLRVSRERKAPTLNPLGLGVVNKARARFGMKDYVPNDSGTSQVEDLLASIIDKYVYGRDRVESNKLGYDVHSVVDLLHSAMNLTSIAGDTTISLANSVGGMAALTTEAAEGAAFTKADLAWASMQAAKSMRHSMPGGADFKKGNPRTLIGKLHRLYDPAADQTQKIPGLIAGGAMERFADSSVLMAPMSMSTQRMELTQTYLMLARKNDRGERLLEAYEIGPDGSLRIKPGRSLSEWGLDTRVSDLVDVDYRTRYRTRFKRLVGNYSDETSPMAKRYVLGRLGLKFKDWFFPFVKRRFTGIGGPKANYGMSDIEEGFYYTFYRLVRSETDYLKALFNPFAKPGDLDLTEVEYHNARKLAVDAVLASVTSALMLAGYALKEAADDDERWYYAVVLLHGARIQSEVVTMFNPKEYERQVKSPIAAMGVIAKATKFLVNVVVQDPLNLMLEGDVTRLKQDSGYSEKGTAKSFHYGIKALGLSAKWYDPVTAIESFEMARGR